MHQVGDQPRLYYDARSTSHQDCYNSLRLSSSDILPLSLQSRQMVCLCPILSVKIFTKNSVLFALNTFEFISIQSLDV